MDDKELASKLKAASELKDEISTLLDDHEVDLDVAISVLMAIATDAAVFQAEMKPEEVIARFASAVCKLTEMRDAKEEREEVRWLN